ncbi:hypothetical protein BC835DRAFT_1305277, partial [Cytidiella melzeri]
MSRWYERVTIPQDSNYQISFRDALAAASTEDGKYVITSPNMSYVPAPCWGRISVAMKADGKFGIEDPMQWPQLHEPSVRFRSLACMPRRNHPRYSAAMWATPTEDDMQQACSNIPGIYVIKATRLDALRNHISELDAEVEDFERTYGAQNQLRWLHLNADTAFECLTIASSPRDLVRQFANLERYCCMIVAFFDFEARFMKLQAFNAAPIVDPHLMGCFTTSPSVASALYYVGIPVWLMRATNSLNEADIVASHDRLELPSGIETSNGLYSTSPIYVGSPGLAQFEAIAYHANSYIDIESKPFPLSYGYTPVEDTPRGQTVTTLSLSTSSQAGTSRNSRSTPSSSSSSSQAGPSRNPRPNARNQPYQHRRPAPTQRSGPAEVDKFSDPPCPSSNLCCLRGKLPLPCWQGDYRLDQRCLGFWTPEPAHVVGTASEPRRHRYVLNWLRIRE